MISAYEFSSTVLNVSFLEADFVGVSFIILKKKKLHHEETANEEKKLIELMGEDK